MPATCFVLHRGSSEKDLRDSSWKQRLRYTRQAAQEQWYRLNLHLLPRSLLSETLPSPLTAFRGAFNDPGTDARSWRNVRFRDLAGLVSQVQRRSAIRPLFGKYEVQRLR